MIRINGTNLIIEIECAGKATPLQMLSDLQSGLIDMARVIDHTNAPEDQVKWGLYNLNFLLKEIMFSAEQCDVIADSLHKNQSALKKFNEK